MHHRQDSQPLSISEAVEHVGFGRAQLTAGILGGGVYLVGGVIVLLASALAEPVAASWRLAAWERGSLMSAVFVGMMIGNSTSGPLGDTFGRKGLIVTSHACTLFSGFFCIFAMGFKTLAVLRLFLGMSLGLGLPPWIVLSTEITPCAWRILMNAYSQSLFILGELYTGAIIFWNDHTMQHLDVKLLTAMGLIPVILFAMLAYFFLVQSPVFLATKGEHTEARHVLSTLARQNGVPADFDIVRQDNAAVNTVGSKDVQFQALFGSRMLYSTLTVIYTIFVLNLIFYGTLYAFPQVAGNVDTGMSPATSVLIAALWELPGLIAGALLGTWFRRLPVIFNCAAGMALALLCFAFGVSMGHIWYAHYLLQIGLVGIKTCANIAFVVVYQYSAEIYPAAARTTGNAVCVSCGRLGAILAPVIFEGLMSRYGHFTPFFLLLALLAAVNCGLALFLPFETAGMNIDDELEPVCPKGQRTSKSCGTRSKLEGP